MPSQWVADGLAGLAGAQVEVVALGRDMGESGDPGPAAVPASVADVEFYVPSFFPSPAGSAVLGQMRALRVVQALTAGVDWLRPHLPPSVALCNARGAHDASTAEWVVAAMLAALRDFPRFTAQQAAGQWAYQGTDQLATKNVLIVGYGSIGVAVEKRLAGFEVSVQRVARSPRPGVAGLGELPSLLPAADVVVLLVPYTPESQGLAGSEFLARMKDGALLVNAARGPVVDTPALVAEVASGRLPRRSPRLLYVPEITLRLRMGGGCLPGLSPVPAMSGLCVAPRHLRGLAALLSGRIPRWHLRLPPGCCCVLRAPAALLYPVSASTRR